MAKKKITTAKKAQVMSAEATKKRRAKAKAKAAATPKGRKISTKDAFKKAFAEQPTPAERKAGATRALTVGRKRLTDAPDKKKKK